MEDKILKYLEFIKEEMTSTIETYMHNKLKIIKKALEDLIPANGQESEEKDEIEKISVRQAKEQSNKELTLKDFNVYQDSSEMLKNKSSMVDSLTFKFSDSDSAYTLYISVEIKDANGATTEEEVKKFSIKFKKYNRSTMELYGEITKDVEITNDEENELKVSISKKAEGGEAGAEPTEEKGSSIDLEDFLLDLKLEVDKKYGDNEEELGIETE